MSAPKNQRKPTGMEWRWIPGLTGQTSDKWFSLDFNPCRFIIPVCGANVTRGKAYEVMLSFRERIEPLEMLRFKLLSLKSQKNLFRITVCCSVERISSFGLGTSAFISFYSNMQNPPNHAPAWINKTGFRWVIIYNMRQVVITLSE